MKKIGVISYNTNHLKTEQVVLKLLHQYDIKIYALPFILRPSREVLFFHRPNQADGVHPEELCKYYGLEYVPVSKDSEIDNNCDIYLITGAGILSAECLRGKCVLNGHPGIIPAARGLDAFKWSIYHSLPLGARRHYETEINLLSNFETHLNDPSNPWHSLPSRNSMRRMKYEQELALQDKFETYKQMYCR